jgi:hypothetical protein
MPDLGRPSPPVNGDAIQVCQNGAVPADQDVRVLHVTVADPEITQASEKILHLGDALAAFFCTDSLVAEKIADPPAGNVLRHNIGAPQEGALPAFDIG